MNINNNIRKNYDRKEPPYDYLKYWRVIRYFVQRKYDLSVADLEVLLFLYSERYFSKDKFDEFDELLSWDVKRFDSLLTRGWITVFRKRIGSARTVYEISFKGRKMINTMYKKLNGEEIPESLSKNPLFHKKVSYTDKVYRNMIIKMNEFIRQQRHRAQE